MKKRNLFILLLATSLILACSLFTGGRENDDTPIGIANPGTESEEKTDISDVDISGLVLTANDFPAVAFTDFPLEEMGISVEDLSNEQFTIESYFALIEAQNFEVVMGFTTKLTSLLEKTGFDLVLNQPELLINTFVGAMGDINAEPETLPAFEDTVGDSSAGVTMLANVEGMNLRMDVVIFRRGQVGAALVTMHLDGQTPPVSLMDVANKFDQKIENFLASQ